MALPSPRQQSRPLYQGDGPVHLFGPKDFPKAPAEGFMKEPIAIEDWLVRLGRLPYKLEKGTRQKIRNIMSAVFRHGMRHGFCPEMRKRIP
jgi:hypothetical protein